MEKESGQLDMFLGLKILYLANKNSLIQWGKTITGDKFVSMPKGPVLSCIHNFSRVRRRENIKRNGTLTSANASTIRSTCLKKLIPAFFLSAKWTFWILLERKSTVMLHGKSLIGSIKHALNGKTRKEAQAQSTLD